MKAKYLDCGDMLEWTPGTYGRIYATEEDKSMMVVHIKGCSFPFYFKPDQEIIAYARVERTEYPE